MRPRILLVNPPIYDFAAYDFWLRPYGLLSVAGQLRGRAEFFLFDYLDRPEDRGWQTGPGNVAKAPGLEDDSCVARRSSWESSGQARPGSRILDPGAGRLGRKDGLQADRWGRGRFA